MIQTAVSVVMVQTEAFGAVIDVFCEVPLGTMDATAEGMLATTGAGPSIALANAICVTAMLASMI